MRDLILFKTVLKKEFIEMKNYLFNTLFGMISIYLIFIFMFFGIKFISPSTVKFGNTIEGLIIGYFIWLSSIFGYSDMSWGIMEEARAGTLEQLSMTPFGLHRVLIYRIISTFLLTFLYTIPMLFLMMITTGKFLHIDLLTVLPLILFTILPSFGLGFTMSGLGLIFKRLQASFQILQFVFIAFLIAPSDKIFAFKFLPFSLGVRLISQNMIHKIKILEMNHLDLIILVIVGFFYFFAGFYIFKVFEKIAKKKGVLGHY